MLGEDQMIGFVPTKDPARARDFYREILGLIPVREDGFAAVFGAGRSTLRVVRVEDFTPQPFTILGWEVADIASAVQTLTDWGVLFTRYEVMGQDERGIWTSPGGDRVAWFTDPDGNTLSISQNA